jgi:hypothetical protein
MKTRSLPQKALLTLFAIFSALAISTPAQAITLIIDDFNIEGPFQFPNFTTNGSWGTYADASCKCYETNLHRADPGDGSSVAHWTFNNLVPGRYRVMATWASNSALATNAPFSVVRQGPNGSPVTDTIPVDETKPPSGFSIPGSNWKPLGTFSTYNSTLEVQLTNAANRIVIADAILIERIEGNPATLDDGDAGFTTAGSWNTYAGAGFQGDIHRADPGDGSSTATWSFSNLSAGRYQVSVSWPQVSTLATNAPFAVTRQRSDGSPAMEIIPVDETQSPGDLAADGTNWKTLGTFPVYGSTLNVQLSNLANGIVVADAVRIKQVEEAPFTRMQTVNAQVTDLFPGTYRLAVRWSTSKPKPQIASTGATPPQGPEINIVLDPNAPGDFTADGYAWKIIGNVTLSIPTQVLKVFYNYANGVQNGAGESLTRMDRMEYLPCIVDDGDAWTQDGGGIWPTYPYASLGYQGDYRRSEPNSTNVYYLWKFPHLGPGLYRIASTWPYASTLATNAPFVVNHLKATLNTYLSDTIPVNQATTPNDFTDSGVGWKNLGTFAVFNSTDTAKSPSLTVRLTGPANGAVLADAVRVVRVGDLPDGPKVELRLGGQSLANGGSVSFGTTFPSVPISKTFTLRNIGSSDLQIGSITPPAGYTLTANVGQTTLPPGEETTFTVRLDATGAGTYNGTLSFSTNDPNANPFQLALNGTVLASRTLDNGDTGFTTTGSWTTYIGAGFQSDIHRANAGDESQTATWSFTNLPTGRYQVALTWPYVSTSATNAPFSVSRQGSGGSTVTDAFVVNERTTPSDFSASGVGWKALGTFDVYWSSVTVKVTNLANGIVLADGVRIERVGDLP